MKKTWVTLFGAICLCAAQESDSTTASQALAPTDAGVSAYYLEKDSSSAEITTSTSGRFRISGGDARMRSTVAFLAESTKDELSTLHKDLEKVTIPISIRLHGQKGDAIPARSIAHDLQWGEEGFRLVLHAHLAQGLNLPVLRSGIFSALIYEKSLRNMPAGPLEEPMIIRPWLSEGLAEAIDWRSGKSDRRLYQAVFQAGGLFPLEEMLSLSQTDWEQSDAAMKSALRVSAGGLIMALLEQPQGDAGFARFLEEAARFGGDMPLLLRKHFPSLSLSQKSLEKWWALQMANQSRLSLTEVMSIEESEVALRAALQLRFRDEQGLIRTRDLSSWQEVIPMPENDRVFAVTQTQETLMRLSYRCFPSFRLLLSDYQKILQTLALGDRKTDFAGIFSELEETRVLLTQRGKRAIDYLDWFEITRARETTGVFDDYIKLKKRLDQGVNPHPDHLDRYLDRMEKLYQR